MKKVLVIDDERDAVEMVKTILEDEGYEVMFALDGRAGLQVAREDVPDAVVLDVQMPIMDGMGVLIEMRRDPRLASTPIIMLTGFSQRSGIPFSKEDMGALTGEEPTAYLEKPVDPAVLLKEIKKAIG